MVMLMLSFNSAWAQYVKVTAEDGTESWIEIRITIIGTYIWVDNDGWQRAIDGNTKGAIDLNDVWSESGGRGTHYQVTGIGDMVFCDCSGLTSVVIPSSVTNIGYQAFYGCSGLTSIVVESGNTVYDSRNNCNAIIETASNTLIVGCMNTVIPFSVTSIGDDAFNNCSGLTSVDIPSSVTSIGNQTFSYCSHLTSVDIPSSVTSIGLFAFYGCSGLTSVEIPSSVTSIGDAAFGYCSGLTSVVVELGNSVYDSRINCNAIIETSSNTLIAGCKNTKIPSSVTSIGYGAFDGCSGLTSVDIPSSVTSIAWYAFRYCSGLTSVDIPSSVTSIGDCTFQYCSGLTSVDIPSSVTSIGYGAFNDCSGLTSISIPSSTTFIGEYAFSGCSGLTSVTSYITEVFQTGEDAFYGCNNASLYVPKGLVSTYQSTADWKRFKNIEEIPDVTLAISCNNKGKVLVNGTTEFTNNMGEVSFYDGLENTFVFTPEGNCQLEQVLIDGLDVTLSVKNNQLKTIIHEGSKMIVTFSKSSGDVNGDGHMNINDVVALVNMILGQ